jgi:hypothetical protein
MMMNRYYVFRRRDDGYVAAVAGTRNPLSKDEFEILLETTSWSLAHDFIALEREKNE